MVWAVFSNFCNFIVCALEYTFVLLFMSLIVAVILMININTATKLCSSKFRNTNGNGNNSNSCCSGEPSATSSQNFAYRFQQEPDTWNATANHQSPINILTDFARANPGILPLRFTNYNTFPKSMTLQNNGRALVLRAKYSNSDEIPTITGGIHICSYNFTELYFHWSWRDYEGSEHLINDRHFPVEVQALHRIADNSDASSSLLMVACFYDISTDNHMLEMIVPYLRNVQDAGRSIKIPPFPLNYIFPEFAANYYSYNGSLTQPPCERDVEWIINPVPLAIGQRQLSELRQLRNNCGVRMLGNARPVQQLGADREVLYNVIY